MDRFEEIIQKALKEAGGIVCSASDYVAELEGWIEEIQTHIQGMSHAVKEEKSNEEKEND